MIKFRRMTMAALVAATLALAAPAGAGGWGPHGNEETPVAGPLEKRVNKFGRGLANVALSLVEIPKGLVLDIDEGRSLGYILTVSPLLGLTRTVVRIGVGLLEVVTFPVSMPSEDFEPIVEPAFVL